MGISFCHVVVSGLMGKLFFRIGITALLRQEYLFKKPKIICISSLLGTYKIFSTGISKFKPALPKS